MRHPHRLALALALTALPSLAFAGAHDDEDEDEVQGFECKGADCSPDPFTVLRRAPGGGGRIGLQLVEMTPELREFFGAPKESGVLVAKVVPESPAAKSGIKVGDVIVRAGEDRIRNVGDLVRAVAESEVGDLLKLTYVRGKSQGTIDVRVDKPGPNDEGPGFHPPMGRFFGNDRVERQLEKLRRRLDRLEEQLQRR